MYHEGKLRFEQEDLFICMCIDFATHAYESLYEMGITIKFMDRLFGDKQKYSVKEMLVNIRASSSLVSLLYAYHVIHHWSQARLGSNESEVVWI